MSKLDKEILEIIKDKTGMTEQAVRNAVSSLKNNKCPKATQNAAAQLFAQSRNFSVARKLTNEDRMTLPTSIEIEKPMKIKQSKHNTSQKKIIELVLYDQQDNYFLKKHIEEINRAYTYNCYTAVYVLLRKVIENMLIDIIRKKFPGNQLNHRELYFDIDRSKFLDLKYILKNLLEKSKDFGPDEQLVKRLVQRSEDFKDDANNKTHSLYHIVTKKKEIDDKNPQEILALIRSLMNRL